MSRSIPAIFESGVFRPLEAVQLPEGTHVVVQLETAVTADSDEVDPETCNSWHSYLDRMESLPDQSPQDGLSNRNHDRIIYGA